MKIKVFCSGLMVLVLLATMSPAQAKTKSWKDPGGGKGSMLDIKRVKVVNNAKGVRITIKFSPYNPAKDMPSGGIYTYIDTGGARGPEFVDGIPIPSEGYFNALKGSSAWKESWLWDYNQPVPKPRRCAATLGGSWRPEKGLARIVIKPKKGCLYRPKKVRVQVRSVFEGNLYSGKKPKKPIRDWFPGKKKYSGWVKYSKR